VSTGGLTALKIYDDYDDNDDDYEMTKYTI
jgi:hypothetical protein